MSSPPPPFETTGAGHGFEDFFNFDMLLASSSSRSSSRSPAHSPAFPPTPPQANPDLFNIGLFDDFAKEADPLAPAIQAPYDFFNAFANYVAATGASPSTATSATAVSPPLAIDPQLVDSPSPQNDDDGEHDEDDDDDVLSIAAADVPKVGGMGKQRKGTVQGGGVQKKVRVAKKEDPKEDPLDDWRPSPEEYKKMSSKEKRQLRNKISARNFRNRRKGQPPGSRQIGPR
jgi:bZIP-type transcription factor MBZ1